ncbi:IS110 family transposase, partial [Geobacillus stearothermophilus]|nr:IS110 family transposase [Geobacillus stearothermophilus]
MQGCQTHHSPYQGGLQMNCTQNYKIDQVTEQTLVVGIDIAKRTHYAC